MFKNIKFTNDKNIVSIIIRKDFNNFEYIICDKNRFIERESYFKNTVIKEQNKANFKKFININYINNGYVLAN